MSVAEQLRCEDEVFLTPVLRAHETDGHQIGPETTLAVDGLKAAIAGIREAGDQYETGRLSAIDDNFAKLDLNSYSREQPKGLPAGRFLTAQLERADTEHIVKFAKWYQKRVAQLGMQLEKDQPLLAEDTLHRTAYLMKQDIFPSEALDIMHRAIQWASKIAPIGSIEQAANDQSGYCGSNGIGLANLYTLPAQPGAISPQLKQTAFHEHLHAVNHIPSEHRGLFGGLTARTTPDGYNRWLEEAYVSQISFEAIIPTTRPPLRPQLINPYRAEEQFLDAAMNASPLPIDLSDLSLAHFSGRNPSTKVRVHVAQGLSAGLNNLLPQFGNNAWEHVNREYNAIERRPDRSYYLELLLLSAGIKLHA